MYTRCTTEKSSAQQAALEHSLLQAMMQRPYGEISVSSLCEQSGFSRKTFYRLFSNKDSVLHALIDHTLMRYMSYRPNGQDLIDTVDDLHNFFSFWLEERQLLDALQANGLSALLVERALRYIETEEPGVLRRFAVYTPEIRPEILLFYLSGIISLVISWHHSGFQKTAQQMGEILKTLMTNPPVKVP